MIQFEPRSELRVSYKY